MEKNIQSVPQYLQETAQTTQDQVTGTFVTYLNAIRLSALADKLLELETRKSAASQEILALRESIARLIESNRGGSKGMHGFIGERVQVAFANVNSLMKGELPEYILIDDNGMTDYLRGDILIQQKACISDGTFGLTHVLAHVKKYPLFVDEKGVYQIPSDFYELYCFFSHIPESEALKFRKEDLRIWKAVKEFNDEAPYIKLEPMEVTYREIQAGVVHDTIDRKEASVEKMHEDQKQIARDSYKPTLQEGIKVTIISAALEGFVDAGLSFAEHAGRKKIRDFDKEDLKEIAIDGAKGSIKGGIRGAVVYTATNFTRIPAPVATAGVTAIYGIVSDIPDLHSKEISGKEFCYRAVEHCTEAAFSAAFSKLGEKFIPIPVLGPLIGNAIGMFAYGFLKKGVICLSENIKSEGEGKNEEKP